MRLWPGSTVRKCVRLRLLPAATLLPVASRACLAHAGVGAAVQQLLQHHCWSDRRILCLSALQIHHSNAHRPSASRETYSTLMVRPFQDVWLVSSSAFCAWSTSSNYVLQSVGSRISSLQVDNQTSQTQAVPGVTCEQRLWSKPNLPGSEWCFRRLKEQAKQLRNAQQCHVKPQQQRPGPQRQRVAGDSAGDCNHECRHHAWKAQGQRQTK